jgi:hypothetical protein
MCVAFFLCFSFKHYRRIVIRLFMLWQSKVAHALAKYGSQAEEECVGWADFVPNILSDLVANDIVVHFG